MPKLQQVFHAINRATSDHKNSPDEEPCPTAVATMLSSPERPLYATPLRPIVDTNHAQGISFQPEALTTIHSSP